MGPSIGNYYVYLLEAHGKNSFLDPMSTKRMCAAAANTPTHLVVAGVKRYCRYPIHVVLKMWRPACIQSVHVHQTRKEYTRLLFATLGY